MSTLENDAIYEAAYEDFIELFNTSLSFKLLVEQLMNRVDLDWYVRKQIDPHEKDLLPYVFNELWKNDCELLVHDKRTAVEALIMFKKSMSVF